MCVCVRRLLRGSDSLAPDVPAAAAGGVHERPAASGGLGAADHHADQSDPADPAERRHAHRESADHHPAPSPAHPADLTAAPQHPRTGTHTHTHTHTAM